mmetsp:Transcript_77481/g.199472  ORF Transcript_77481/g.199472 Transcript_77481/m.199472 type:complete len:214 (-) Transcript_77481:136-777(-)
MPVPSGGRQQLAEERQHCDAQVLTIFCAPKLSNMLTSVLVQPPLLCSILADCGQVDLDAVAVVHQLLALGLDRECATLIPVNLAMLRVGELFHGDNRLGHSRVNLHEVLGISGDGLGVGRHLGEEQEELVGDALVLLRVGEVVFAPGVDRRHDAPVELLSHQAHVGLARRNGCHAIASLGTGCCLQGARCDHALQSQCHGWLVTLGSACHSRQ